MEELIQIRCDSDFKEEAEKTAKERGHSSVSEYIRFTIKNDMKDNGKKRS